jgi:hypothetical protein
MQLHGAQCLLGCSRCALQGMGATGSKLDDHYRSQYEQERQPFKLADSENKGFYPYHTRKDPSWGGPELGKSWVKLAYSDHQGFYHYHSQHQQEKPSFKLVARYKTGIKLPDTLEDLAW